VLAIGIMAFFLSIYRVKGYVAPIGWDTSKYVWRTSLARVLGITHLQEGVPIGVFGDPSRPGFVVIGSTLASITRSNLFATAAILPATSAAAIGLAAGAFVSAILRRPRWEFAVTAIAVGTSAFVIRLAGPETYQDNLFAAAVFMAAVVAVPLALEDPRALLPAVLLLGAGGVIHWAFLAFMLGTLGLTALIYLPRSFREWRAGGSLWSTPAARLAVVTGGGAALAGATIYGLLSSGPRSPKLALREFVKKLRLDTPKYRFQVTLPLAAVGAASLAGPSRGNDRGGRLARFALVFFLAWCGVALAGYVGLRFFNLAIPGHRFLAFTLAVPILAVSGVLALTRLVAAKNARLAGVLLTVVLLSGTALSLRLWLRTPPSIEPAKIGEATAAAAYLDAAGVQHDRPVIVIVPPYDGSYTALVGNMFRAVLPWDRIANMYLYLGSVENYLARRPTPVADPIRGPIANGYFDRLVSTYDRNPIALVVRSFDRAEFERWATSHPDSVVHDGIAVVAGGPTRASPAPTPKSPLGLGQPMLGFRAVAFVAILSAIGLGWTLLLLRPWLRPLEMLALSPAVGIAALVPAGILVDRLGFRLVGAGALSTVLLAGGLGWGLVALTVRRRPGDDFVSGRQIPGVPVSSPSSSPGEATAAERGASAGSQSRTTG
jgi:hypothetical protein